MESKQIHHENIVLGLDENLNGCRFARRHRQLILDSFAPTRAALTGESLEEVLVIQATDDATPVPGGQVRFRVSRTREGGYLVAPAAAGGWPGVVCQEARQAGWIAGKLSRLRWPADHHAQRRVLQQAEDAVTHFFWDYLDSAIVAEQQSHKEVV